MPDLPPERLHEIVGPVWTKHPGTRPEGLEFRDGAWWLHTDIGDIGGLVRILPWSATLLCEAQMTRWLWERDQIAMDVDAAASAKDGYFYFLQTSSGEYAKPTRVEALAAACMAVPEERP